MGNCVHNRALTLTSSLRMEAFFCAPLDYFQFVMLPLAFISMGIKVIHIARRIVCALRIYSIQYENIHAYSYQILENG